MYNTKQKKSYQHHLPYSHRRTYHHDLHLSTLPHHVRLHQQLRLMAADMLRLFVDLLRSMAVDLLRMVEIVSVPHEVDGG